MLSQNHPVAGVTLRAMWRRGVSLLLAAVAALGVCAAMVLQNITIRQEQALAYTIETSTISCTVVDARGSGSDHIQMISAFVEMLLGLRRERGCDVDQYVRHVRAKATAPLVLPDHTAMRRILSLDSDPALDPAEGAAVHFYDGWTEEVLMGQEQVCLVAAGMETEDGYFTISSQPGSTTRLRIVGTITGGPGNTIYCPFFMPYEAGTSVAFMVDSCSFDIRDNRNLEACKAGIYQWFVEPDPNNQLNGLTFGVLVHDETYRKSLEEIQSNLSMLRLLLPVLMILVGCIGCFASYLTTRGRVKEFAVMRCLGLKQRQVFALVFLEQVVLAAAGSLLGGLTGIGLEGQLHLASLGKAGGLLLVFLAGAALAALRVTSVNVMKLMKAEE